MDPAILVLQERGHEHERCYVDALRSQHTQVVDLSGSSIDDAMATGICAYSSELFYDSRLHSRAGLERQVIVAAPPFEGAGLWIVEVDHDGNQTSSAEEVDAVERIVNLLLCDGARWIDGDSSVRPLTANDILVVAPYNAHVALLGERLGARSIRVGTVDKFQGQEAPVVIYSMATSRPEDAPYEDLNALC